jgi:hypothetical protein
MARRFTLLWLAALLAAAGMACSGMAKPPEITDPEEAKADPDFAVQGEYVADGLGAQVVALGKGEFDMVVYKGGLPGAGWKRGDERWRMKGRRDGEVTTLEGEGGWTGRIAGGKLVIASPEGKTISLARTERKSPTLGAKPPEGAVVLFDGTDAEKFDRPDHFTDQKTLLAGVTTKDSFDSHTLHLEFRLSWMPEARGQGRSNSGVYLHDAYEVQVLDSFGLEGRHNECGGIYSIRDPDVNMCFPPMQWQTFDFEFTAPKYENGEKVANARVTIKHNGVVIHDDLELPKGTPGRKGEGPAPRPFHLQGHGNQVHYRNIWLKEK